jgi:hypothetical protein
MSSKENKDIEKPILDNCTFSFDKDGNCVDGGFESIDIEYKSSLGIDRGGGGFFVIKTQGWSLDSVEELEELFNRIRKVL